MADQENPLGGVVEGGNMWPVSSDRMLGTFLYIIYIYIYIVKIDPALRSTTVEDFCLAIQ